MCRLGIPAIADKSVKNLTDQLMNGRYHYIVEADIKGFFNHLDVWFYTMVQRHCRGQIYLCHYADDFVCAFELERDAKHFYKALKFRLERFNLQLAEKKTQLMVFSRYRLQPKTSFYFLVFVNFGGD